MKEATEPPSPGKSNTTSVVNTANTSNNINLADPMNMPISKPLLTRQRGVYYSCTSKRPFIPFIPNLTTEYTTN